MSQIINVHINGDKSKFKSKNSIQRLKKFLKKNFNDSYTIDNSSYFLEGYESELRKEDNNIFVNIKKIKNVKKNDNRKKLREKLKSLKEMRSGKTIRSAHELKKQIPKNVLKSFVELTKNFDIPVPKPNEILNNPDKYIKMAKLYASGAKLSPDEKMNKLLGKYFTQICKLLNVEPDNKNNLDMKKINKLANEFYKKDSFKNEKTEEETEEETEYNVLNNNELEINEMI